ncbi:MAG: adenine phosphoribosyltransferase [Cyclobacteriaceae bacterium]|nr:adenine phosphoribosyltransferase [Cyclobacteriaceae bacterium]
MQLTEKLIQTIRDVQDYPKPGILFKDITPVLADPALVHAITMHLVEELRPLRIDAIAGVEARGFLFGAILAHELQCRFIPVRKAGRLPFHTRSQEYALEYGTATIEMHTDAVQPGWRVLVHDDLLATGGTAGAAAELIKSFGGELAGFSFLINLGFLPGEKNLIDRFGVKPQYLVKY